MGKQNMQAKEVYWREPWGEQFTNVWVSCGFLGVMKLAKCVFQVRAFHKLLEIFQKVSHNFPKSLLKSCSKNNQKLLFLTKVAQKLLEKTKTYFGLKLKFVNCTTKVRFLSIFVQFHDVTSVAK